MEQKRRQRLQRLIAVGVGGIAITLSLLYTAFIRKQAADEANRLAMEEKHNSEIALRDLTNKVFLPCLDSIEATTTLAAAENKELWAAASKEFWSLYYGPMIVLEDTERRHGGGRSIIAQSMVSFGDKLPWKAGEFPTALPVEGLVEAAHSVKAACVEYLSRRPTN